MVWSPIATAAAALDVDVPSCEPVLSCMAKVVELSSTNAPGRYSVDAAARFQVYEPTTCRPPAAAATGALIVILLLAVPTAAAATRNDPVTIFPRRVHDVNAGELATVALCTSVGVHVDRLPYSARMIHAAPEYINRRSVSVSTMCWPSNGAPGRVPEVQMNGPRA